MDGVNAAFLFNSGWSGDDITFAGKVSGTGYMVREIGDGSVRQLRFTGDVSDWTGGYNRYDDNTDTRYTSNVFFTGNPLTEKDGVDEADRVVEIHANVDSRQNGTGDGKGRINLTVENTNKVVYDGNIYIARNLTGKSNDGCGKLETSGTGAKAFEGTVNAEKLVAAGGEVSFAQGASFGSTTLANLDNDAPGTVQNVTISSSNITGAGTDLERLGKLVSMSIELATSARVAVSDVVMHDVQVTYGAVTFDNVKAVASAASVVQNDAPAVQSRMAARDAGGESAGELSLSAIKVNGSVAGDLTVDIASSLLSPPNAGKTLVWTILDDVTVDPGFSLALGDTLGYLLNNGHTAMLTWSESAEGGTVNSTTVTAANMGAINIGGLITANVGDLVLTIEDIPEPTTGALSVLALAALAARRRRKKD